MIGALAIYAWPVLVAQLLIFGTAAFEVMFAPVALTEEGGLFTVWRVLAILNLAMSPLVFMEIAAGMAQASWGQTLPLLSDIVRFTLAGRVWMLRLGAALALAIVVWMPLRATSMTVSVLVLATTLVVCSSLTSHAIDRGMPIVGCYAIHQMAGAIWLGALVALLLSARRGGETLAAFTPRVSTVCGWAVGCLALSGVTVAFQWLGWNFHLMFDSAYGRTLMWKLGLAAAILALGAYNRYWQVPGMRHRTVRTILVRTVSSECVLLMAVLAFSAILANTPPPH